MKITDKKLATLLAIIASSGVPSSHAKDRPGQTDARTNCGIELTQDSHYKAGQSDEPGDRKATEVHCRIGRTVVSLGESLDTPRKTVRGQFDTAKIGVVAGREGVQDGLNWSVTGRAGLMNGRALDALHDVYLMEHELSGKKGMRVSPGSTSERVYTGVAGRVAVSRRVAALPLNGDLRVSTGALATAGNDEVSAGGQAFASLMFNGDNNFVPPPVGVAGLVTPLNRGTGVSAGIQVKNTFYDASTARLRTNRIQASFVPGAQIQLGNVTAHMSVEVPLTERVRDAGSLGARTQKSVNFYRLGLNYQF